jgi:signal transduction histidine kinase
MKVLYVEDEEPFRESLERQLLKAGYSVKTATNAREGLEVATVWKPDAIILDIWIGKLDGLVLAAQLQSAKDPDLRRTPLLAFTVTDSETLRGRALAAGCVGYFNKLPNDLDPLRIMEPYLHGKRDELTNAERIEYMRINTGELVEALKGQIEEADQKLLEAQRAHHNLARAERLLTAGQQSLAFAHEIQNPLQAVRSALDVLGGKSVSKENRDIALTIAKKELQRTTNIINMLLDAPKAGDDQVTEVDIADLIDAVLSLLHSQISQSHIEIQYILQHGDCTIRAVYVRIHQILFNLMLNAIEMMPAGGVLSLTLEHTIKEITEDNKKKKEIPMIKICVGDTGRGVSIDDRLFEPFYTTKPNGHGLGLYVCELLAKASDGYMGYSNNPTGGATFTLTIPA